MKLDCGGWIVILAHKVKKRLNETTSGFGVTGVQSRILGYILEHCRKGPVFQKDVEDAFGLSRSTATGILQLMEKNEEGDPGDGSGADRGDFPGTAAGLSGGRGKDFRKPGPALERARVRTA